MMVAPSTSSRHQTCRSTCSQIQRLGVPPAACLVFEDAPLGIEAARRAGMRAFALTTTLPAEAFATFDNLIGIAPDFTGLSPATLIPGA